MDSGIVNIKELKMRATAIKKMELIHKIGKLPEQKIFKVDNYLQNILSQLRQLIELKHRHYII